MTRTQEERDGVKGAAPVAPPEALDGGWGKMTQTQVERDVGKGIAPVAPPEAPDGGWGWVVLVGAFISYFIADGWSYSFGVLFLELISNFGDGKGKTAVIAALLYGVPLLISPVICAATNIYGCKIVAIIGGLLTTLSFIISSFANSVSFLCLSTGLLASVGLSMTYIPAIVVVTFYFDKHRGLATGLAVTGSGLGTIAFPPLVEFLFASYTWRGALLITGAICLNLVVAGALFRPLSVTSSAGAELPCREQVEYVSVPASPKQHMQRGLGNVLMPRLHARSRSPKIHKGNQTLSLNNLNNIEGDHHNSTDSVHQGLCTTDTHQGEAQSPSCPDLYLTASERHGSTLNLSPGTNTVTVLEKQSGCSRLWREVTSLVNSMLDKSLVKSGSYILFCVSSFLLFLWVGVPYIYLIDKANSMNVKGDTVFLTSVIGIGRTVGQILLGVIGDRPWANTIWLYAAGTVIIGVDTLLLPLCTTYATLCLYCAVFGFFASVTYVLPLMCLVEMVGLTRTTSAFGLLQLVQGVATLLGTPITGWLYDVTGDYDSSFYIAGAWMTASGLLLLPIPHLLKRSAASSQIPQ